ncbi:MAG TPA: NAD(P)-dependent oxidoreductase [Myxococcota bacterium]|jgi:nucleoside-diphosphate-sugar epimerase|nr:NAD(P)-dependent oxidoreductase [Myxococcota bacterium]
MRILVTGSSGHLGEGLVRTLRERDHEVVGLDLLDSPYTTHVGSICDPDFLRRHMRGIGRVIHAATLHKPHVATHPARAFVETNVTGTLSVLEAALESGVPGVVYSSTTSVFGSALRPAAEQPAAWIDEQVVSVPRNIYGVTKKAAEDLCELFYRSRGLPCVVLRTGRFFPEADDDPELRDRYDDLNLKVNELLYRRLDLADAVEAHVLAAERAPELGFRRYVVSATSPFEPEHLPRLRTDAPGVVRSLFPDSEEVYRRRGWRMLPGIDRVYVNRRAREELGFAPRIDFREALDRLRRGDDVSSPLARAVGSKGYHAQRFEEGPYPVERSR